MPKFSVVIAVFNKEKYIADTLKSVLGQTFTDFEVVILNDGSTDNSEAEILKFKDSQNSLLFQRKSRRIRCTKFYHKTGKFRIYSIDGCR